MRGPLLRRPVLFGILAILSFVPLARPAGAQSITWNEVGCGEMLVRSPEGALRPLPIVHLAIDVDVTGTMSRGRVVQSFVNPGPELIDGVYAFPLPDGAAVHRMEIRVGDRTIVAEIREREEARRTYEAAKASGRKAALVEQKRPNLFTTEVANINPGEQVDVELEYFEEVRFEDGSFRLRVPLTFTPRFHPPGTSDGTAGLQPPASRPRARVRIVLDTGFPLADLDGISHPLKTRRDRGRVQAEPLGGEVVADRDLVLHWTPELDTRASSHLLIEERDDQRFAMVMFLPPSPESDPALALPTETLFIVDVSRSMSGPSMEQARQALRAAVSRLRPEDRFNLMRFNNSNELFRDGFQQAEGEALDSALRWIADLEANGGTMIEPALRRGMRLMRDSGSYLLQRIVFLTDGAVGNESALIEAIHRELGDTRLHTIGIGNAPNSWLMRRMARDGRGLCAFIASTDKADNEIARFLERIDQPVLAGLQLNLDEAGLVDVSPAVLPDLHAGEPLVLSARLRPDARPELLRLGGYTRDGWSEIAIKDGGSRSERAGVALRWARTRVAALMGSLFEGADPAAVRNEVIGLALDHHLVTRYTSLVAVEQIPTAGLPAADGRLPAALPTGGTDRPLRLLLGAMLAVAGLLGLRLVREGRPA